MVLTNAKLGLLEVMTCTLGQGLPQVAAARLAFALAATTGCLSVDSIPTEEARICSEETDPDPLIGSWTGEQGVCEFLSNGRYSDRCGIVESGFASDWMHLDDGRYYFGASSLGSPAGECLARATFADDCTKVTLSMSCNRRPAKKLALTLRR